MIIPTIVIIIIIIIIIIITHYEILTQVLAGGLLL